MIHLKIYRLSSLVYPKKLFLRYKEMLDYANLKSEASSFIGFVTVFGFLLGWALAFPLAKIFGFNLLLTFFLAFIAFEVFIYMWLSLSIDAKAKFIEKTLPDALQLMASNLRAGLTSERALLLSARPEFGPLADEINRVGKEVSVGKTVDEALMGITKRVKSKRIEKIVALLVSGIRSGGELASLLDHTSRNMRNQDLIDQKVRSSVRMYVIFVFIAVGLGAPMLFALSSFLVDVLTKILGGLDIPVSSATQMPITISKVSIEPRFIIKYVMTSLVINSIMGSLVLGAISKGSEKEGLKIAPLLIMIAIVIFFLIRLIISTMLTGLFNI